MADSLNEGDSRDASVIAWLNLEAGELQLLETDVSEVDFHLEVHVPRQRPLDIAVTWDFTLARLRNGMGQFEGLSCFGLARREPQLQLIRDFQRLLVCDRLEDTLPLRSMTAAVGIEAINLPCIEATEFVFEGQLNGKGLWIPKLQCRLFGGSFTAEGDLDFPTRRFGSKVRFDFDGHRIAGLLTLRARRWLSQFGWEKPPEVAAEISLRVPQWHGAAPRWAVDVRPGIQLEGEFRAGAGDFQFDRIRDSRFSFDTRLEEASIHLLSQQFSSQSERVEGKFNAHILLSQGQWSQWETWQGYGSVRLSDGVLTTSDLRIKAPPFDIRYRGRLTLNGEFDDARLSLHLPQEPIAFGSFTRPTFIPISRMSEHRIVGSLKDMKIEPVLFLPRLFKALFL